MLSCFAITNAWTPQRPATGTRYSWYRQAAGYRLWPTDVFIDDVPDPRNEVHYDLIVTKGPNLDPGGHLTGSPAQRRAAHARLAPTFTRVLTDLGEPRKLPARLPSAGGDH